MKKVKITVLKTMLNEELAKEYGIPGLKAEPTPTLPKGGSSKTREAHSPAFSNAV